MDFTNLSTSELIDRLQQLEQENVLLKQKNHELTYRTILESVDEIVYEYDAEGLITYISPLVEPCTGFKSDEIVGMNIIDFIGVDIHFLANKMHEIQQEKKSLSKYQIKHKNGESRWVQLSSKAIFEGDKFCGVTGILTDITEIQLGEIKNQKIETLYSSILNVSPDAIILTDMTGVVTYVSPAVYNIYHSENINDYIGHYLFSFMIEGDRERAKLNTQKRLNGERVGVMEYTGVRVDGSEFYFDADSEVIKDEAGKTTSLLYVIRDITVRKIAEQNLVRSEENYRLITEKISDVVWLMDLHGNSTFVSNSIEKFTGYSVEEYKQQTIQQRFTPESAQIAATVLKQELSKQFSPEDLKDYSVKLELDYLCKDGNIKTGELLISPLTDFSGVFVGIHGVTRDITERKANEKALRESEEKYRTIFETVQDAYYEASIEGVVLEVSPSIKTISRGLLTREQFVGNSIVDLYADPNARAVFKQKLLAEGRVVDYELEFKQGNLIVPVAISSNLVCDSSGKPFKIIGSIRDISERKQVEAALRLSEEKYRLLFANNPQPMWIYDLETLAILEVNNSSMQQYGYTREEFLQMNIKDMRPVEDIPELLNDVAQAARNKSSKGVWRHIWKNGKLRFVEITAQPVDFNGRKARHVLINDITERIQSEIALRESENKFRSITEQTSDFIAVTDANGFITYASSASASVFLLQPEEMLGCNFLQFVAETDLISSQTDFARIMENGTVIKDSVHLMKRADGEVFYGELNGSKFQTSSHEGVLVTIRDITERKNAEDELRKLSRAVEQSPVSIVITNLDGDIEYANPKACETTGYTLDELVGKNPRVLQSGETPSNEYVALWETIASGTEWHGTFHNKKKTGELYWESSTISPISNEFGEVTNYVAIKEDITERKKNEEALFRSETDLNYAQEIARMGSWELNLLTGEYTWSKNNYRMVGIPEDTKVTIEYFYSMIFPDDVAVFEEKMALLKQNNVAVVIEIRLVLPTNGTIVWIENSIVPVVQNDKLIGIKGVNLDITERKKGEEKIQNSESSLNYAQEIAKMGSWELNVHTQETSWSANEYKLLGLEPNADIDIREYFSAHIHPDDRYLQQEVLQTLLTTRKATSNEFRYIMPDGSIKWLQGDVSPIFDGDDIIKFIGTHIDITDKKNTENALRNSESSLNYAQEIANMCSWVFYKETKELHVSRNFYSIHKINPSLTGVELFKLTQERIHPDDKKINADLLASGFPEGITQSIESRILLPDGLISWIKGYIIPEYSEGKLVTLRGVNIDITERKQKDDQINKLSLVATQSPVAIVITDLKGNMEFVNPAFEEMTGYSFEMVKGKNTRILKSGKNKKDVYENLWSTINRGNRWQTEWENKKRNGEFYWESISITPIFNESGHIENFLALKQDITKRKQDEQEIRDLNLNLEKRIQERTSQLANININLLNEIAERKKTEQKFSMAFHSSSAMMAISDMETGRYLDVNNTFVEVLGYTREEIIGKTYTEVGIFRDPDLRSKIIDGIVSGGTARKLEVLVYSKQGALLMGLMSADLIYIGDRRCLLSVTHDITDRKIAEEELKKARQEADKANVAKSEFLSRMSHELRTPMNSILGFAQLLDMGELNTSQKRGVNHILRSGKHLLDLINEVLDISRIEAGRLSISIEPIELGNTLREMMDIMSPLAVEQQITLKLIESSSNLFFVSADRQSLKQVLLNLINNAIKYNKKAGSVAITTELKPVDDNGVSFVRVSIADTGTGISDDDLPKLFIPFERLGAFNSRIEGTGLGLAVVKKLIDAMGGNIGVESVSGQGSTFWFELPQTESQLQHMESDVSVASGNPHFKYHGTILYIEDNSSNIELVEQILNSKRPGIRLLCNMNGNHAVNRAVECSPDLIFLDLNLPDIHGSEVLNQLQQNDKTKNIPVVVISADAMHDQIKKILNKGARKYLTKPFDVNSVLNAVDEFIVN